jgi:phosphatidylglycerophosphate synthase
MGEPVHRNSSIEEFTNALVFQPLSSWLAPMLVRWDISANATSLAGMAAGVGGALLYGAYASSTAAVLIGFALMCLWHVLDGADGQVARMTNTQSPLGKLIDGVCDYVVFITAYVVLGLQLAASWSGLAWPLVITAGLFHAVQSGAYEAQRQMFDYWALGKQSARIGAREPARSASPAGLTMRLYEWVQLRASAISPAYLAALEHKIGRPDKANPMSVAYARTFAAPVRRWGVMSANYRTYGLFLSCLVGRPEAYFLAEIILLGPLLLIMVARQHRRNRQFVSDEFVGQIG